MSVDDSGLEVLKKSAIEVTPGDNSEYKLRVDASVSIDTSALATSANQASELTLLTSLDGKFGSLGQKVMAGSVPVVLPSDQTVPVSGTFWQATQPVSIAQPATPTVATVASSATNVTLFASNSSARGRALFNESTQILYLKLGTTASATSYTVQMAANSYYEVPFGYTGRIDGIWASANGNARTTELV